MSRPALRSLMLVGLCAAAAACASKPKSGPTPGLAAGEAPLVSGQAPGAADGASGAAARPGSQADLAANAGERVYFAFDSHDLDAQARDTLVQQARWLARYPDVRVLIAGAADERGTREYNLALGARRAAAAQRFLVDQGVSSTRLRTISWGKERPVDTASTEEAWAKNRNAQTLVIETAGAAR